MGLRATDGGVLQRRRRTAKKPTEAGGADGATRGDAEATTRWRDRVGTTTSEDAATELQQWRTCGAAPVAVSNRGDRRARELTDELQQRQARWRVDRRWMAGSAAAAAAVARLRRRRGERRGATA
ncbi:hypothetical protein Scep_016288 [Stephania cephalantha]|uniref:Uncharacterized protein n=1 Tax=Stephania cephalantha TaxID=152367 RepID=A0AAP0NUH7_9MAGN